MKMFMKNIVKMIAGVAMTTTLLIATTSCGDDNDGWKQYLTKGNEARPAWSTPSDIYQTFEFTMAVQVTLQDELLPYASDDDLMCATIGDEVRAVTTLQRTGGEVYFPLVIAGSSGSGKVSLRYYCAQLRRTYTLDGWMPFTPGISPTQDGLPYVVEFIPVNN